MITKYRNESLSIVKKQLGSILIVHYSSEGLNDNNEGYSPRITSIVVHNLNSRISHSFSIHLEAEILKISKNDIDGKYDQLEKSMLRNFFDFVKNYTNYNWLHWNMRNIHYGFEMIEHRYKVLGANDDEIIKIPDRKRFNISDLIIDSYGENAISHPRMAKLMNLNGGEPKGFLSGEDEAKAFKNKEYVKLHESTLSKIGWFRDIFILLIEKKIKTERSNWNIKAHNACDSVAIKIVGVIASISGVCAVIVSVYHYFIG